MTDRLSLPPRYRRMVEELLREHMPDAEVWAYGSRVNGESHDGSDLDLVVRGPDLNPLGVEFIDLVEALQESDIPILVQAHDWANLPESFHREIEREYVVVQSHGQGEWRETLWGDLVTLAYGKSLRGYKSSDGRYKVYGTNGPIGWHSEPLCHKASVIIGRKGAYRGVHYSPDPFFVIDTAFYLQPKVELDTRWAYYNLLTVDINGMDSGSAIPSTSREDFYGLLVDVPPLSEQKAIAHVLGTLDDKIELNRRMNETLEAMALALFKAWFVDFEPVRAKKEGRWRRGESLPGLPAEHYDLFPDRLVDSELGEIPEGWTVRRLGDCYDLMMGQSPPGNTYNDNGKGLPFFQGSTDFGERYPTNRRYCTKPARLAQTEDTLVSVRAPVGTINRAWEQCCIGRGVAALRHKSGSAPYTYYAIWVAQPEIGQYEHTGTVFGAIGGQQFRSLQMLEPPQDTIAAFQRIGQDLDSRIRSNVAESRALAAQKDTLLPKLVSGEVGVGKIHVE